MTAQAVVFTPNAGPQEIRGLYKKHLLRAVIVATIVHLSAIGSYYIAGFFVEAEETAIPIKIRYIDLGPSPSIAPIESVPQVAVSVPAPGPGAGIPVPVPDAEVQPDQTIATQRELSEIQNPMVGTGSGGGVVIVDQDITVEDEDPPEFVAVEQMPTRIRIVSPAYPEIARRAGLEGTVWVRILVDREGKPKKAVVGKSDSEIFNDNAVKAAMGFVFTPAMMNNGPVAVWVVVPFYFKLNK